MTEKSPKYYIRYEIWKEKELLREGRVEVEVFVLARCARLKKPIPCEKDEQCLLFYNTALLSALARIDRH